MPHLVNTVREMAKLFISFVRRPRISGDLTEQVPSAAEGLEFSRRANFRNFGEKANVPDVSNPLLNYFDGHREGPGIWKWKHYFEIYQRHFSKFVGREVHVMEVGIYSGGSLAMWKEYFGPQCRVYGVDIEKACLAYRDAKTEVFIGDQADRSFWAKVRREVPDIDILIDDGGHQPEQQRITFEEILPHLRAGGVYLCEDISGTSNRFAAYVKGFASGLNAAAPGKMLTGTDGNAHEPSQLQKAIDSVHLYPFVAVIEKRERELDELVAPKHGTRWQPFL